jgi:hypothetical protein
MNHGRFRLLPTLRRAPIRRPLFCALALLLLPDLANAAETATTQNAPALRLTWSAPDHPSGIYYVKEEGALTVLADGAGPDAAELSGEILFGSSLGGPDEDGGFKILSVTPITPAAIKPGQRAKIPLQLAFGAAGEYELRWRRDGRTQIIASDTPGWDLQCIFAPRGTDPKKPADTPWVTTLPRAAAGHPGFLTDYAQRTTVRRFLIEERFAFDPGTNIGLGFGTSISTSAKEIDALLAEAAAAKVKLILRVTLPPASGNAATDTRTVAAFREYVADAMRRSKGALSALAVVPDGEATETQRRHFAACYQAAGEAAKKADKNIILLGAGSALGTAIWLTDASRTSLLDALALADTALDVAAARTLFTGAKKPLHILPPRSGRPWPPAAAGLAAGAALMAAPPPELDHGVTAHLFGGAAFTQRLRLTVPTANPAEPDSTDIPFVAVFQGDGYALAAIAGFGAGTDLDSLYPALARTPTRVESGKTGDSPTMPALCIGDDTRSMRVVDSAGAPVDCRIGDNLFVPAQESVMYVLEGGAAADLAGSLRVATPTGLPAFEITVEPAAEGLTAHLHNVATRELAGTLRLIRVASPPDTGSVTLIEKEFAPLPPGKSADLSLDLSAEQIQALRSPPSPLTLEIRTTGSKPLVQRSTLTLPATRP